VERVFHLFAGDGAELDGREFLKMCTDITGMLGKKFNKQDVDIVFAAAAHGKKKMGLASYKDAVARIAGKKGQAVSDVQAVIARSDGPHKTGVTKAQYSRFHDDTSTYTGAHAAGGDHGPDRHAQHLAEEQALKDGDEGENDWGPAMHVYGLYAHDGALVSKEWLKLCEECKFFGHGSKFKKEDVDVTFTTAVRDQSNKRKLEQEAFKIALRIVAKKMHTEVYKVQQMVAANSTGPVMHGTEVIGSRFYDDESTWTGTAAT